MGTRVKDIMTSPVVTCVIDADVGKVRHLMKVKRCSAIPIVEIKGEQILIRGMVTNNDLVGTFDDNVPASQIMTEGVIITDPEASAQEAARLMLEHGTHHLLVLEHTRIAGMLSSLDYVRMIAE